MKEKYKVLREHASGETNLGSIVFINGGWVMENFPLGVILKSIFDSCTGGFRDGLIVDIGN